MRQRRSNQPNTLVTMIVVLILSVPAFWLLWFVMGTTAHRICAVVALPILDFWVIISHFNEKRADRKAASRRTDYLSGAYYQDPQWRENFLRYSREHGFEVCHERGARWDMLQRYRRKSEPVTLMLFLGFLIFCFVVAMIREFHILVLLVFPLILYFFWLALAEFIGMPVRRWLRKYREDPELDKWLKSWASGRILSYQTTGVVNGICLSRPYILLYDSKEVHTVELSVAEALTREIVREKLYQDSTFSGDKYRFYAVLHVQTAQGTVELRTELNEYQLEMAVEEFGRIKQEVQKPLPEMRETFTNEVVT